ncbi:hypothetical protein B7Y94_05040 [Candidatus Saccharibacteria bacterium 32-49-12]|nr:MAG: hypothetical protein B7Y94_05040 [Candidatus Saccharibacteria bacterium 32-49-12]
MNKYVVVRSERLTKAAPTKGLSDNQQESRLTLLGHADPWILLNSDGAELMKQPAQHPLAGEHDWILSDLATAHSPLIQVSNADTLPFDALDAQPAHHLVNRTKGMLPLA